jgi:hypothetical protein
LTCPSCASARRSAIEEIPPEYAHDPGDSRHLIEIGTAQHPVALDARVDEPGHAAPAGALDRGLGGDLRLLGPAGCRHAPAAGVDRHDHAVAIGGDHLVEEVNVTEGGGAEHDSRGARVHGGAHAGGIAQSAADLDRNVDGRRDPADVLEVRRGAGASAIEIDDVQCPGARVDPAARGIERIGVVHGSLLEVPPGQAHRLAVEDVDRRQQDHARRAAAGPATPPPAHRPTKFSSIASP